jgi:hypothetical protein
MRREVFDLKKKKKMVMEKDMKNKQENGKTIFFSRKTFDKLR